ncbi:hypothetical protein ANN_26264 [Periplaneta americana]|uniref:Uncharacterized protein n=1 Tax=Periplaneta americana TaxID=6978 RepID=A0ABQ8S617_PERAM|nr:hypothetical protein ANN_26264 [Periplaneta americana]
MARAKRKCCGVPSRFPDLIPPDFYLWGVLKNTVYATKPQTLEELRVQIEHACNDIPLAKIQLICRSVIARYNDDDNVFRRNVTGNPFNLRECNLKTILFVMSINVCEVQDVDQVLDASLNDDDNDEDYDQDVFTVNKLTESSYEESLF